MSKSVFYVTGQQEQTGNFKNSCFVKECAGEVEMHIISNSIEGKSIQQSKHAHIDDMKILDRLKQYDDKENTTLG
jgi:hypothetical protein